MATTLDELRESTTAPLANEVDVAPTSEEESITEFLGVQEDIDEMTRKAVEAMYGPSFPLLDNPEDGETWVKWARDLWDRHSGAVEKRLHLVERNRLGYKGIQWISSIGNGPWREPPKPRDTARVVYNLIAPALDQRTQIVAEQRPGFRTRPASDDIDDVRKAEAKQIAIEYQYDQQKMSKVIREASHRAGTDGTAFLELSWDPDRGPWEEAYMPDGMPMGPTGEPAQRPHQFQLGDLKTTVRRIEHVRVSSNATSTQRPWYWVICDRMSLAEAVKMYGPDVSQDSEHSDVAEAGTVSPLVRQGYMIPEEEENFVDQDTVDRYTVYCERSEYLPGGLTLIVVGDKVVFQGPLLIGRVPMVRWSDGCPDPAFFNAPFMDRWWDPQMRINAILSKWVENVRLNAGPKLLSKGNAIVGETLVGGTMTVIEARGLGSLSDIAKPLDGFSLAPDAKELLALSVKAFEDETGYNDVSRGQFSSDQSGRAILAIREQLERIFAPVVTAAAEAMTDWAEISLLFMKWGYDIPRTVSVQGEGRPDLTRSLISEDFNGATDVWIDPETLMPLPRALRLNIINDMFDRGLLSPEQVKRRMPFAWARNLGTEDQAHEARARRAVEALKQGQWLPVLWMDKENIHMDILEREILLQDDSDPKVRAQAFDRWMQLAQQQMMKMGGGIPGQTPAPPAFPNGGASSPGFPAQSQPMSGTNPAVAAPGQTVGGVTDEQAAGTAFDQQSPL